VDANALGVIRVMKKSEGGNTEEYLPVVYNKIKRQLLYPFEKSPKPHNDNYRSLYWSKRSKQYPQLPMVTNERNKKSPIYWSKRSKDQDFKDFLPFSTIIRHENLMQPDQLFQTNV
jgi:hypothetical protein